MALVWPSYFPQTMNRSGFERRLGDGRLVSPTEVGPGKMRRRTAATVKPVSGSMWMTRLQRDRFEAWWEDDAGGGTKRFWFPAIGTHGFPMRDDDGDILLTGSGEPLLQDAWWLVQFAQTGEPPGWASIGDDTWDVTISLEILP